MRAQPNRAAIYTRVSKDKSGTHRSVDRQEVECRAVVDREGWTLIEVWSDNDTGASKYSKGSRPNWQVVCEAIERGKIDFLVVWEVSRATRDRVVWAALTELCVTHNVKLCVGGKVHDLGDPDDAFILDLLASLGVRESGVTRKRILSDTRQNALKGRPHGPVPYGYERRYDPVTKTLIGQFIVESEALVVREVYSRLLSGDAVSAIARDFNERGLPPPRPGVYKRRVAGRTAKPNRWLPATVTRMARRPTYAGLRVFRGEVLYEVEAIWQPIVDLDTYQRVLNLLTSPGRRTAFDTRAKYLLSGVATCGVCNEFVRTQQSTRSKTMRYVCSSRNAHVARRMEPVDLMVERAILHRLSRPDALDILQPVEDRTKRQQAVADISDLRRRRSDARDAYRQGRLSIDSWTAIDAELNEDIGELEKIGRIPAPAPALQRFVGVEDVASLWNTLDIAIKREIVRAMMEIVIHRGTSSHYFDPDTVKLAFRSVDA